MRYRLCDFVIESELPLPELSSAPGFAREEFVLRRGVEAVPDPGRYDWYHEWRYPDGELWSSFARIDDRYICRFAEIADFHLNLENRSIECRPVPGVPDSTLGHIFLNQIMPIVLSATGDRFVLHASAVSIHQRAVAFLGLTGQGKSTLAGAFCRAGFPLLTDDFLVLEDGTSEPRALPTYGGLRLWDDVVPAVAGVGAQAPAVAHFTDKKRISLRDFALPFCAEALPLDRIYLLESVSAGNDSGVTITPIPRRDAVVEFTRFSFHLDLTAGNTRRREFARAARLANTTACYRLTYPRELDQLAAVRQAVLAHLGDDRGPH